MLTRRAKAYSSSGSLV